MVRSSSLNGSDKVADNAIKAYVVFWIVWLALKIIAVPVFFINLIWFVQSIQQGSTGTFDFSWLIISIIGMLIL